MKKVAVIQSNYIPWKGYFDIIHDVDLFVFYDDVQYTKNDWRNRNRVKTRQGPCWLTIPVGGQDKKLIHQVEITNTSWQKKHYETIRQSYGHAPFFKNMAGLLEHVYCEVEWANLSVLNQYLIKTISLEVLGLKTEFRDSREYGAEGSKSERLVDLLRKVEADAYVSGPNAKAYLDASLFEQHGIALSYKDYSGYPEYPQLWPPFEHAVSIVDVLLNCGPDAPYFIWGWREQQRV